MPCRRDEIAEWAGVKGQGNPTRRGAGNRSRVMGNRLQIGATNNASIQSLAQGIVCTGCRAMSSEGLT
jgi:hypothetical protein